MTTELLFRDDAYLRTASARVVAVHERGIELDRTIFYPQGGGQVGDSGTLVRANGERIGIADTRKAIRPTASFTFPAPRCPRPTSAKRSRSRSTGHGAMH
jgi:Ser-tRNA(Ala) deacylase AlaX